MLEDSLLEHLREALACPSLEGHVQADWSSHSPQHRTRIRRALLEKLGILESSDEGAGLLDLSRRPLHEEFSISISHCGKLGGYTLARSSRHAIGLDIEEDGRVRETVALRVSSSIEVAAAPSPTHLWVAKESAFKALGQTIQLQTISELQVRTWAQIPLEENLSSFAPFYEFQVSKIQTPELLAGKGVTFPLSGSLLSFFALQLST